MRKKTSIFLVLAFSSFYSSQTGVEGSNIPELFTTHNSSVTIPCICNTGTDKEYTTPISWTRVRRDGYVETMMAPSEPNFVPRGNVELLPISNNFPSLVVSNMVQSLSGVYTCHTEKGNASTLVRVVNEIPSVTSSHESKNSNSTKRPCSEFFDLVNGRCLYYHNEKMNWKEAHNECVRKTSSLITFKDVKDMISFLLNLQKSGSTNYEFPLWTGHSLIDESQTSFGSLQNDPQVSPMLYKGNAVLSYCGLLLSVEHSTIFGRPSELCNSLKFNFICEQPIL